MNGQAVIVPLDAIDENDLVEFIGRIKVLTHADVRIQRQFVLTSDSPSVLSGLEFLFGEVMVKPEYQNPKATGKDNAKLKAKLEKRAKIIKAGWDKSGEQKPAPTRGPHVRSIKVLETGEMISRFELDKRLREHTIEPGTQLHSPKHGTMTVKDNADELFLVNEAGEQL